MNYVIQTVDGLMNILKQRGWKHGKGMRIKCASKCIYVSAFYLTPFPLHSTLSMHHKNRPYYSLLFNRKINQLLNIINGTSWFTGDTLSSNHILHSKCTFSCDEWQNIVTWTVPMLDEKFLFENRWNCFALIFSPRNVF